MKTTVQKNKQPIASPKRTEQPSQQHTPNSVVLSAFGEQRRSSNDLEAKMAARMQTFRDAQLPGAEREADAIASSVNPSASIEEVKSTLGQRLGADFSGVNIHTGAGARDMADSIGADAYTQGRDVYLGEGASNAQTVAHELVHTVQQGGVSGFGVSQSAAFGTVQMKPGKRARLKNWFKRKFHGKPTTSTNENGETVTFDGVDKIIEPDELMGTRAFELMHDGVAVGKTENYKHTDATARVRKMEEGEFDSGFDNLEIDAKVHELQRLAQYLSAAREEGPLSERDQALEKTYKSSLQKATASDDFMKEIMRQSIEAADAMMEKERIAREIKKEDAEKMGYLEEGFEEKLFENLKSSYKDQAKSKARERTGDHAKARHVYDATVESDEGRRFNSLRFMMDDAANLMEDGKRRYKWNELRRQHFSKEEKGLKGIHEGQRKTMLEDGTVDYTDISRYVKKMHSGSNTFNIANSVDVQPKQGVMKENHRKKNKAYMASYKLPGQK